MDIASDILWALDGLFFTPELFLTTMTLALLVYGLLFPHFKNVNVLSILILGCTFYLLLNQPIEQGMAFNSNFIIDEVTQTLKTFILLCSIVILVYSFDYSKTERWHSFECIILILLSTLSMMIMVSAYDFMTLYLTIELQSLCFYVLAASMRNSEYSIESGLKYFVLGALASGILLFGMTLVYTFTGLIHFEDLAKFVHAYPANVGLNIGILCIFVALLFKLTAAPFHLWAPDVYAAAPTIVTAYFSLVPKIALIGVFLRIGIWTFYADPNGIWNHVLLICAILSLILGAFGALAQTNIKRLLAYSSINHVGYMLLGFACGTLEGLQALFLYLFVYLVMTIAVFGIVLSLRSKNKSLQYISDFSHLSKSNPVLAFTFALTLFSLAGIPPVAGFFSKFYLFFAAISSSFYIGACIAVITSCISCFYYLRLIKIMYFEMNAPWLSFPQIDREKAVCISASLFALVFIFVYPTPFFLLAQKLALSLDGVQHFQN
jgi:proton-translocating NADH-quinone oxidoreductase chain N